MGGEGQEMVLGKEAGRTWEGGFLSLGQLEALKVFKQQVTTSAVALGRSLLLLGGERIGGPLSLSYSLQLLRITKDGQVKPVNALRAS